MAERSRLLLATALAVVCGALYTTLSLLRFRRFEVSSWDNAIFEQAVKGYANLGLPVVDIKGPDFVQLGDHFSPVVVLVAPFYRIVPSAQTILVAQAALIAVSVGVVAHLALRRLGLWTGLAIGVAYGLSFGIQSAVQADFHEVAFGAPLLALAGAAYVDRRFDRVVWWSLPLLLVKEDLGLTVAVIGVVLCLAGDRRRGGWLAFGGLAAMAVIVLAIVPAINPGDTYAYASSIGGDQGLWGTLFDESGRKIATVVLTLAITGVGALLSPWVLVVLPTFAWRFASDNAYYWGTDWHYSLLLMPIVFVALIDAMSRPGRPALLRRALRVAPVAGLVVVAVMQSGSPLSALVRAETWQLPSRVESAREVVAMVPAGASIEGDIGVIGHLVTDHTVYWLGTVGDARPQYVLFDLESGLGSPTDVVAYAEETHGGQYTLLYDHDGYVLARRS